MKVGVCFRRTRPGGGFLGDEPTFKIEYALLAQIGSLPVRIRHWLGIPEIDRIESLVTLVVTRARELGIGGRNRFKCGTRSIYGEWVAGSKPIIDHADPAS